MPQSHPNRRDSWPPTILRIIEDDLETLPETDLHLDFEGNIDMDSNPFEYFLTSPQDPIEEDIYFEDLSAGIEAMDTPTTPVREVSPSSLQRLPIPTPKHDSHLNTPGQGFAVPLSLHDFALSYSAAEKNRTSQSLNTEPTADEITANNHTPPATARGRRPVRLGPRGRGKTRSLESPRPRSWREPSPDVWSIPEEEEEAPGLSADEDAIVLPKEPAKPKKRVHWAI